MLCYVKTEKVKLLHLLFPDVKASCTWKKGTSVSALPLVTLENDELNRLVIENRSILADQKTGEQIVI